MDAGSIEIFKSAILNPANATNPKIAAIFQVLRLFA